MYLKKKKNGRGGGGGDPDPCRPIREISPRVFISRVAGGWVLSMVKPLMRHE